MPGARKLAAPLQIFHQDGFANFSRYTAEAVAHLRHTRYNCLLLLLQLWDAPGHSVVVYVGALCGSHKLVVCAEGRPRRRGQRNRPRGVGRTGYLFCFEERCPRPQRQALAGFK
jgi:hypothetical protein